MFCSWSLGSLASHVKLKLNKNLSDCFSYASRKLDVEGHLLVVFCGVEEVVIVSCGVFIVWLGFADKASALI